MQQLKDKFLNPDQSKYGSIQSCIRTNDIDLVGDGTHLTYFEMIGNFSFGRNDYLESIELWHSIVNDLKLPITSVHYHPSRNDHKNYWMKLGYNLIPDESCVWSDGNIGGNCCELYIGELEIGNLVNTQEHSVDVGFGLERMLQILEQKNRVDETSLFTQGVHPVVSDHIRSLNNFFINNINPGEKGRNYICRKLLRRLMKYFDYSFKLNFQDWLESERETHDKKIITGLKMWKRYKDKPQKFWYDTFGLLPEDLDYIKTHVY